MPAGQRLRLGLLAFAAFAIASAFVLLPVKTADPGMSLAFVPHRDAVRRVRFVVPGGAADRAGLRAGDEIDLEAMSVADRLTLAYGSAPSDLHLMIRRGTEAFATVLRLQPNGPGLPRWTIALTLLMNAVYFGLAIALLRNAASRPEGRLLFWWIVFVIASNTLYQIFAPSGWLALIGAFGTALPAIGFYYCMSQFLLIVPRRDSALSRYLTRLVLPATFTIVAGLTYSNLVQIQPTWDFIIGTWSFGTSALFLADLVFTALYMTIILDGWLHCMPSRRVQLQWVAITVVPAGFMDATRSVYFIATGHGASFLDTIAFPLETIIALGPAYAVLRHRMVDIEFIVSRAAIYTLVSGALLAVFVVIEWTITAVAEALLGRWASGSFERYPGLIAALLVGLFARPVHRVFEQSLNRVFFRRRHRNETALRQFGREAELQTDAEALLAAAFMALQEHVEGSYVAVVVKDGSGYRYVHTNHAFRRSIIAGDEPIVLRLRRAAEPFEVREREEELYQAVLVPMTVLGELVAFLACGPKADRTRYGSEELDVLAGFAQRVGTAYTLLRERQAAAREASAGYPSRE